MIEYKRTQSQTVRSYTSAIRSVLKDDGVELNEDKFLLSSLTRACKLHNDRVRTRLPIQKAMMLELLKTVQQYCIQEINQPYLNALFQAMISTAYFGLFRVSEFTGGPHAIKAIDTHIADNKTKVLFVLCSSKTHGLYTKLQLVRISSRELGTGRNNNKAFCPYKLLNDYFLLRPTYDTPYEPLFIFRDRTPVTSSQFRSYLKFILNKAGFNEKLYGTHSLHSGRATDLLKFHIPVSTIKKIGRWSSNIVYTYLT